MSNTLLILHKLYILEITQHLSQASAKQLQTNPPIFPGIFLCILCNLDSHGFIVFLDEILNILTPEDMLPNESYLYFELLRSYSYCEKITII